MKNAAAGADIHLDADLTGADTTQMSGLLGLGAIGLTGGIDAHALIDFSGGTVSQLSRKNRGALVLSMTGGAIDRRLIEFASTDVRTLFRAAEGTARIVCMLGVLDLRDGRGRVAPLRIRTSTPARSRGPERST